MNSNGQKVKLACTDPSVGDFIFAYEMKAITAEDRDRFERHLFDCDYCLEELERFEPYADAVRADNERLRRAARAQKLEPVRFPVAVPDLTPGQQMEAEKPTGWDRFRGSFRVPKWAMAAAALLVVALMLSRFQPQDPARWAVVQEPDILSRSQVKGPVEEAHDLTLTGDYPSAARRLGAEIQGGRGDVRIRLYLAYVYLKQDRDRAAVELLDQCLTVAQAPLDDEARWLRANALLKDGQLDPARRAFEEIAGRGRAHSREARAVLDKLNGTR